MGRHGRDHSKRVRKLPLLYGVETLAKPPPANSNRRESERAVDLFQRALNAALGDAAVDAIIS